MIDEMSVRLKRKPKSIKMAEGYKSSNYDPLIVDEYRANVL